MVQAQQWVNKHYPLEERKKITQLDISKRGRFHNHGIRDNLEGSLKLEGLTNLEDFSCFGYHKGHKITNLDLSDCPKLKKINCGDNNLAELNCSGCPELETVYCFGNQLTKLILPKPFKIKLLACDSNRLTDLSFISNLESEECLSLNFLALGNNDFPRQDLSLFSKFTNLEQLHLSNHFSDTNFYGSLEPLRNLSKLWNLNINNTNIDSGLEYLPNSMEFIYCWASKGKGYAVSRIAKALKNYQPIKTAYGGRYSYGKGCYFQEWRKDNLYLITTIREDESLLPVLNIISKKDLSSERNKKVLNILIFNLEQEIIDSRKKLYKEEQFQAQVEHLSE